MIIKKALVLCSLLIIFIHVKAQSEIKIEDIDQQSEAENLSRAQFLSESKTMEHSIKLLMAEVGNNQFYLYVAISKFGPDTLNNLFKAGPFYNPELVAWEKIQLSPGFIIESGLKSRSQIHLSVNLNTIQIHAIDKLPD